MEEREKKMSVVNLKPVRPPGKQHVKALCGVKARHMAQYSAVNNACKLM